LARIGTDQSTFFLYAVTQLYFICMKGSGWARVGAFTLSILFPVGRFCVVFGSNSVVRCEQKGLSISSSSGIQKVCVGAFLLGALWFWWQRREDLIFN